MSGDQQRLVVPYVIDEPLGTVSITESTFSIDDDLDEPFGWDRTAAFASDMRALWSFRSRALSARRSTAPVVVVNEHGRSLSPLGFTETKVSWSPDLQHRGGIGHPLGEALGLPAGTDWVRTHAMHLQFMGLPWSPRPHLSTTIQLSGGGDDTTWLPYPAVDLHWSNRGDRVAFVSYPSTDDDAPEQLGPVVQVLDVATGRVQCLAALRATVVFGPSIRWSPSDRYLLVHSPGPPITVVIDLTTGQCRTPPVQGFAMDWDPRCDGVLISATPAPGAFLDHVANIPVLRHDLVTGRSETIAVLDAPPERAWWLRHLRMHPGGEKALTVAPLGCSPGDQLDRGGKGVASLIDLSNGTVEELFDAFLPDRSLGRSHDDVDWTVHREPVSSVEVPLDHWPAAQVFAADDVDARLAGANQRRHDAERLTERAWAFALVGRQFRDDVEAAWSAALHCDADAARSTRQALEREFPVSAFYRVPPDAGLIDLGALATSVELAAATCLVAERISEVASAARVLRGERSSAGWWEMSLGRLLLSPDARTIVLLAAFALSWLDALARQPDLARVLPAPSRPVAVRLFTEAVARIGDLGETQLLGMAGLRPLTPATMGERFIERLVTFVEVE